MKYSGTLFALLLLTVSALAFQANASGAGRTKKSKSTVDPKSGSAPAIPAATQEPALEAVLSQMDSAAAAFRTAEANVMTEDYQKVVDDHHTENGKVYFRKTGKGLQMAMDFTSSPDSKYVLLIDNKVRLYQPKIDQVTEYTITSNSADIESMFALGFGGRGHDLLKSFDVKLVGSETMDGGNVSRLELTPKTQGLKRYFSRIELWFDLAKQVPVQQQFWQPSGDYHLAHYTNIKRNQKIPEDVFKLKATSRTKVVTP